LRSSNTYILTSSFIITHIHFLPEKTIIFIKQENYKILVPTENVRRQPIVA